MKKKYTHIFFDLDNTLWDFKKNSFVALEETFRFYFRDNHHCTFDEFFEVYSEINHSLWKDYRKQRVQKNELLWLRFQKTFEQLNIHGLNAKDLNNSYFEKMPLQTNLVKGVVNILEYLRSKGYRMSIISNGFREVQYKKLENSGILHYFEKVFLSEDLKIPKPAAEIFEYAIKSVNAKKSRSLMVGDDWETDITGAINIGIDAVYYNTEENMNKNKIYLTKHSDSVFFVNGLDQLKTYV